MGLQQTFYSVRESQGVLRSVCASLTGEADRRVVVNISTIGNSARGMSCIFRLWEIVGFDLKFCILYLYTYIDYMHFLQLVVISLHYYQRTSPLNLEQCSVVLI